MITQTDKRLKAFDLVMRFGHIIDAFAEMFSSQDVASFRKEIEDGGADDSVVRDKFEGIIESLDEFVNECEGGTEDSRRCIAKIRASDKPIVEAIKEAIKEEISKIKDSEEVSQLNTIYWNKILKSKKVNEVDDIIADIWKFIELLSNEKETK